MARARRELVQELSREPTPEELARRAELPQRKVDRVLGAASVVSLQAPLGEGQLADVVPNERAEDPFCAMDRTDQHERAERALSLLEPRERRVLRLRYGIGERSDHTLEEIGRALGLTRERVRQIEMAALAKIRRRAG
jgi:RNA polymerase primary sigma factor